MSDLGEAVLELRTSDAGLAAGLDEAKVQSEEATGEMGGHFSKLGEVMAAAGGVMLAAFAFKDIFGELTEMQSADAQTTATVRDLGKASGETAASIEGQASSLQMWSGYSKVAIQSGENMILTVGNINTKTREGKAAFDEANKVTLDYAARTGTDVPAAAAKLAKAIADPENAMSRLGKQLGISKDAQAALKKEMEATNDPTKRQTELMDALEQKIGGSAHQRLQEFSVQWGLLKDILTEGAAKILSAVLPALTSVISFFTAHTSQVDDFKDKVGSAIGYVAGVVWPMLLTAAQGVWSFIGPIITTTITAISDVVHETSSALSGSVMSGLSGVTSFFTAHAAQIQKFRTDIQTAIMYIANVLWPMLLDAIKAAMAWIEANVLPPVEKILSNLAATTQVWLAAIAKFWQDHGAAILDDIQSVWGVIVPIISDALKVISDVIDTALALLRGDWGGAWSDFKSLLSDAWNLIKATLTAELDEIRIELDLALKGLEILFTGCWDLIKDAIKAAWDGYVDLIKLEIEAIVTVVKTEIAIVEAVLSAAWTAVKTAMSAAWNGMVSLVSTAMSGIVTALKALGNLLKTAVVTAFNGLKSLGSWLLQQGEQLATAIIQGIVQGIKAGAGAVGSALEGIAKGALNSAKSALGIHSPSTVFADEVGAPIVDGVVLGMQGGLAAAATSAQTMAQSMVDAASKTKEKFDDKIAAEATATAQKLANMAAALQAGLDALQNASSLQQASYNLQVAIAGGTPTTTEETTRLATLKKEYAQQSAALKKDAPNMTPQQRIDAINALTDLQNQINDINTALAPPAADTSSSTVPAMASGGIVTKPTLALIGEGGENEAVVPLSKAAQMGFGGGNGKPTTLENHQHFYGANPDQFSASRHALFAFRTAGLVGARAR